MADVAQYDRPIDHKWRGVRGRGEDMASLSGVIGPNAVIQLAAALDASHGREDTERVFAQAGASDLLAKLPSRMVDEVRVQRLYDALDDMKAPDQSIAIAYDSGRRTADYVRVNRIPAPARIIIRLLPSAIGARLLLKAIVAHAWTFAGSGAVQAKAGDPVLIEITDNPLRTREGQWHRGVLEGLFDALIVRQTRVRYRSLLRDGRPVCRFEIDLGRG